MSSGDEFSEDVWSIGVASRVQLQNPSCDVLRPHIPQLQFWIVAEQFEAGGIAGQDGATAGKRFQNGLVEAAMVLKVFCCPFPTKAVRSKCKGKAALHQGTVKQGAKRAHGDCADKLARRQSRHKLVEKAHKLGIFNMHTLEGSLPSASFCPR